MGGFSDVNLPPSGESIGGIAFMSWVADPNGNVWIFGGAGTENEEYTRK